MNDDFKTSKLGINIIKRFEGCRLEAYRCPSKVLTIGYGHTVGVKEGMVISQEQADELLAKDLIVYENYVKKYVKVAINQHQFDALVSLVYNIGAGNFASSTVLRKLNHKDYDGACAAFAMWNKGNNLKILQGLVIRRKAEMALFSAL